MFPDFDRVVLAAVANVNPDLIPEMLDDEDACVSSVFSFSSFLLY